MGKRRNNHIASSVESVQENAPLSLIEARRLFVQDIRGLAYHTQRWHRENLNALVKVLDSQGIEVEDVRKLNRALIRNHFVFYMLEELNLKVNTINGRIRSVRAMTKFLHKEGYIVHDFGRDLELLKGNRVVIQTFSEEQIEALLRQPNRKTFTGLRDYTIMLLLLETGIRISEGIKMLTFE